MSVASDLTRPTARVLATFVGARGHHYHATAVIARGGMAEVFSGFRADEDGELRPVAIKRLDAPDTPEVLLAFDDEARIVSALAHPGIVELIDHGLSGEQPFQVLEHVDGLDLRHVVGACRERGLSIPPGLALSMVADAAEALHAAHEARDTQGRPLDVIHRDVSPHNLLVSWDGAVKVADFGIALWAHRSAFTAPGMVKGKLSFMAPEQLLGRALDRRVDVFGLGCVLAYLFTGNSPFASEAARAAALRGVGPLLDESVPAPIARIVACAAAPDRALRYASALELGLACRRAARALAPTPKLADWLRLLDDRPGRRAPASLPAPVLDLESSLGIATLVPPDALVNDTDVEGTQRAEPVRVDARAPLRHHRTSLIGRSVSTARESAPALVLEARATPLSTPLDRLVLEGRRGDVGRGTLYDARDAAGVTRWVHVLSAEHGRDARVLGALAQEVLRDRVSDQGPGLRAVDFGFAPDAAWVAYEVVDGVSLQALDASLGPHDHAARVAIAWALLGAWRRARAWDTALGGELVERRWSLAPGAVWIGADGRARLLDHLLGARGTPHAEPGRVLAALLRDALADEVLGDLPSELDAGRAAAASALRLEELLERDGPQGVLVERVRALRSRGQALPQPQSHGELGLETLPSSPGPAPLAPAPRGVRLSAAMVAGVGLAIAAAAVVAGAWVAI